MHWVSQGKSNWEVAQILGCVEKTVKKHLQRIKPRGRGELSTGIIRSAETVGDAACSRSISELASRRILGSRLLPLQMMTFATSNLRSVLRPSRSRNR